MPTPNLTIVDEALVDLLAADSALVAAGGPVYWGRAPQNTLKFVLVSRLAYASAPGLADADGWQEPVYAVTAKAQTTSWNGVLTAADRIHELLHYQPWPTLAGTPYTLMQSRLDEPIRLNELDPQNVPTGFLIGGGQYAVMVSGPTHD
jgi:hypothetical protein